MRRLRWPILALFLIAKLQADNFLVVKDGPLHESYVVQEFGTHVLQIAPNQAPNKIKEIAPSQVDAESIWIPGYWAWSRVHSQFLWVSGTWRRPPPNHQWISGYWKKIDDGWVWVRGFWSQIKEEDLTYIPTAPPDPIDEIVPPLPSSQGDYFWIPGYWHYQAHSQEYIWFSGIWTEPLSHWTYVPPQYIWREKGYVINPSFWDWPLDHRGVLFSSIYISPENVDLIAYEPTNVLQYPMVIQLLFPNWPNYICLFRYNYYFHNEAWSAWGAAPPWWNWPTWWCYSWPDTWWLWWWWSHPGYPNPNWLNKNVTDLIIPPPFFVKKIMDSIQPPVNVTPNGVIGDKKIIDAFEKISGRKIPILPSDPKQILQIQEIARPFASHAPFLLPTGKETPSKAPEKIFIHSSQYNLEMHSEKVTLPPVPTLSPQTPEMPSKNEEIGWENSPSLPPPYDESDFSSQEGMSPSQSPQLPEEQTQPTSPIPLPPRTQLPSQTPHAKYPELYTTPTPQNPLPHPSQTQPILPSDTQDENPLEQSNPNLAPTEGNPLVPSPMYPQNRSDIESQQDLPSEKPAQSNPLNFRKHRRTPMETEHHDAFMGHPQPQINPVEPKVYPTPGHYSTVPSH